MYGLSAPVVVGADVTNVFDAVSVGTVSVFSSVVVVVMALLSQDAVAAYSKAEVTLSSGIQYGSHIWALTQIEVANDLASKTSSP